jgi:hypothetical protein
MAEKALLWKLTNGCAWNAVSAFANCGRAVAFLRRQLCAQIQTLAPEKTHLLACLLAVKAFEAVELW